MVFLSKAVNRGKGLLPDPTAMQILTGLNNPATLKMLLNPMSQGHKQGEASSATLNQRFNSAICSDAVNIDVVLVQASSGQPPQCRCWPTPLSLLPCSSCSFRIKPRPSRYCYPSAFAPTRSFLPFLHPGFNLSPSTHSLLCPSLPLASLFGKSSSVGSGATQ